MLNSEPQTQPRLKDIAQFEAENPALAGRLHWICWRSEPRKRTRPGNGGEREVQELKPNGFAPAFLKVCGRWYVDESEWWRIVAEQNGRGGIGSQAVG